MLSRVVAPFALALIVAGCGKLKTDDDYYSGGGDRPSGPKATGKSDGDGASKPTQPTTRTPVRPGRLWSTEDERATAQPTAGLGEWRQVGDIRMRIDGATIGKPRVKPLFGRTEYVADKDYLLIHFTVENLSKSKKLEYGRPRNGFGSHAAKLTDEHDNDYRTGPYEDDEVNGHTGRATIYPGDPPVQDVLCFQRPVDAATELRLTVAPYWLPGNEPFRFRIPASA